MVQYSIQLGEPAVVTSRLVAVTFNWPASADVAATKLTVKVTGSVPDLNKPC
jgi:hypothetical protein